MEFKNFLVKAKKSTYATSGESGEKRNEDGSKELSFQEHNYNYKDRYFGHNPFIGEEIVWKEGKLFWGMNYYGEVIEEKINPSLVYEFLKKALKQVDIEAPFRGPKEFKENDFEYFNEYEGNLESFNGIEVIKFKGEKVYYLHYHGGLAKRRTTLK
jgi:hypothetical protein